MSENIGLYLLDAFPWLSYYISLLAFLAPIIGGGEFGVIAVAFIFADSYINIIKITFLSCLGMVTLDFLWFLFARSKLLLRFKEWKKVSKHYRKVEEHLEKLSGRNDFLTIILAKVMIGTRILLTLYIGKRKISTGMYLFYNFIANIIWATCLVAIGIAAAKGFYSIINIFKNIQLAITFLIVVIVIFYILQKWISRRLMEKQRL